MGPPLAPLLSLRLGQGASPGPLAKVCSAGRLNRALAHCGEEGRKPSVRLSKKGCEHRRVPKHKEHKMDGDGLRCPALPLARSLLQRVSARLRCTASWPGDSGHSSYAPESPTKGSDADKEVGSVSHKLSTTCPDTSTRPLPCGRCAAGAVSEGLAGGTHQLSLNTAQELLHSPAARQSHGTCFSGTTRQAAQTAAAHTFAWQNTERGAIP